MSVSIKCGDLASDSEEFIKEFLEDNPLEKEEGKILGTLGAYELDFLNIKKDLDVPFIMEIEDMQGIVTVANHYCQNLVNRKKVISTFKSRDLKPTEDQIQKAMEVANNGIMLTLQQTLDKIFQKLLKKNVTETCVIMIPKCEQYPKGWYLQIGGEDD